MKKSVLLFCIIVLSFTNRTINAQSIQTHASILDSVNWHADNYDEKFFSDHKAAGMGALNLWMQSYNWRSNPDNKVNKKSRMELLFSGDTAQVSMANNKIQQECQQLLTNIDGWKKKNIESHIPAIWIELYLRAPDKLTEKTKQSIKAALLALNISAKETGYTRNIGNPGSNGANIHGYITPLTLAPSLINDAATKTNSQFALVSELNFMNNNGDENEFNLLESHWEGASSWSTIKQYIADPNLKRMAQFITERLWINRYLTWSPNIQRNTGAGSRMAPSEWMGADAERFLFATGISHPIWLNMFFQWDGWDAHNFRNIYELLPTQVNLPNLPPYLEDIAWNKSFPNLLQGTVTIKNWKPYPLLPGVPFGNLVRPIKYVNYQTENYTIGSTSASWTANASDVVACAWWNSSRSAEQPVGSPERFCVLYPHYVYNGMSPLDKGDIYLQNSPDKPLADAKGGDSGPWLREFADYGRVGAIQDRNTLVMSYTPKPGTPLPNQDLVKEKTQRASAAMFLFRWKDGIDGLFINRSPVKSLPAQLSPGDWWFIEDGDVYAAVLPLNTTALKGNCKITLEKRNHHIVLYADNVNADNIIGIADADWVKAKSGFVVEMGNKKEYGSFNAFRDKMLAAKVTADQETNFDRHIAYQRDDHQLDMDWNCYSEQYTSRQIGGNDDPWTRAVKSPEFSVGDSGVVSVNNSSVKTTAGNSLWLLSSPASKTWVTYQANTEKILPINFNFPLGSIQAQQFPFGKIAVHKVNDTELNIDIDASYRSSDNIKSGSIQVNVANTISKINVTINGVSYDQSSIKKSNNTFIISPSVKAAQIQTTMMDHGVN